MNLNQVDLGKLFPLSLSHVRFLGCSSKYDSAKQEDRDLWRSLFDGIKIVFRLFSSSASFAIFSSPYLCTFLAGRLVPFSYFLLSRPFLLETVSRNIEIPRTLRSYGYVVERALISDYFDLPRGSRINSRTS